ncbi:MAG: hypothetical protein AAGD32_13765 [Planctomycetota bacterium]
MNDTTMPHRFRLRNTAGQPVTGVAPVVTLQKSDETDYLAASGVVTELGDGEYSLAGHADDRDTLGPMGVKIEAPGAITLWGQVVIVSHNPYAIAGITSAQVAEAIETTRQIAGKIDDAGVNGSLAAVAFGTNRENLFEPGDVIQQSGSREVMLVVAVANFDVQVVRGYAGTTAEALVDDGEIWRIGHASLLPASDADGEHDVTFTVQNSVPEPLQNAKIQISSQGAIVRTLDNTDVAGQAQTTLDSGNYTAHVSLDGFYLKAHAFTVSGDGNVVIDLTPLVVPAHNVSQCVGTLTTYDGQGNPETNIKVTFTLVSVNDGTPTGEAYNTGSFYVRSDESAFVSVTLLQNAVYRMSRGGSIVEVTTPTSPGQFALPDLYGSGE